MGRRQHLLPRPWGGKLHEVAGSPANGHLNEAQSKLLADLESSDEDEASVEGVATKSRGGKAKPVRHSLHRTPSQAQKARWEAMQQAREQGLSLRTIARELGMARDTVGKYAKAENPPTKKLSAKELAKAEALTASSTAAD